jgi:hypothetical protein
VSSSRNQSTENFAQDFLVRAFVPLYQDSETLLAWSDGEVALLEKEKIDLG